MAAHPCFDGAVFVRVPAVEVLLTIRAGAVVRIGAASHAKLVRVIAAGVLHRDTVLQGLARVAANNLVDTPGLRGQSQQHAPDRKAGELIVGREQRVGLRLTLNLLHLDERLVARAGLGPGGINRPAQAVHVGRVHPAVRQIRVMRDGQQVVAGLALGIHPVPQFRGVHRVQRRKRHLRNLGAVAEKHVAVQVAVVGHRGPLIGTKGGELARFVGRVGDVVILFPDRASNLFGHQRFDRRARQQLDDSQEGPLLLFLAVGVGDD